MSHIYIAGIAMTVFGRHLERGLHDLAGEALAGALKDAGCQVADLGVAFYAGVTNGPLQGQLSIPGQVVLSKLGIEAIPIYNVENGCASGSSAFNLAVQSLKAGTTDVALAIGAASFAVILLSRRLVPRVPGAVVALVGSLLFTLTLVPVLSALAFRGGCRTWRGRGGSPSATGKSAARRCAAASASTSEAGRTTPTPTSATASASSSSII